jgi:NTE family protein
MKCGEPYSDGGILNHFPTDILLQANVTILSVFMSVYSKIEAKDLNSIRSVTTRAFDILSANTNTQNLISANGSSNLQLNMYSTFEMNKAKMDIIFKIGYKLEKKT